MSRNMAYGLLALVGISAVLWWTGCPWFGGGGGGGGGGPTVTASITPSVNPVHSTGVTNLTLTLSVNGQPVPSLLVTLAADPAKLTVPANVRSDSVGAFAPIRATAGTVAVDTPVTVTATARGHDEDVIVTVRPPIIVSADPTSTITVYPSIREDPATSEKIFEYAFRATDGAGTGLDVIKGVHLTAAKPMKLIPTPKGASSVNPDVGHRVTPAGGGQQEVWQVVYNADVQSGTVTIQNDVDHGGTVTLVFREMVNGAPRARTVTVPGPD